MKMNINDINFSLRSKQLYNPQCQCNVALSEEVSLTKLKKSKNLAP